MIKMVHFHQLMSNPWKIVTSDDIDGVSEDNIPKITQSTSENKTPKSKISQRQNPTQMIKVDSFY